MEADIRNVVRAVDCSLARKPTADPSANSAELIESNPLMGETTSLMGADARFLEIEHQRKCQRMLQQRAYEKIGP